METTLHYDESAQFDGSDGECLCGIAVYEIRDDWRMDVRTVELIALKIGQLILSRTEVSDAVGKETVEKNEVYVSETQALPDPMGAKADRAFDRGYSEWAAQ